jgi:hypothetical protein
MRLIGRKESYMATKQQEIEELYAKPLAEVLIEEYNAVGNVRAVAKKLGVQPSIISYWVRALGLKFVTRLEPAYKASKKGRAALHQEVVS